MRAGIFLAYGPWSTAEEQVELAQLGDRLGPDSVWVSQAWGQDAVSVLGLLAGRTERIALGSGLLQIPARQPTATAMAAATLDVRSGGRFRLGLGVSGPQVSQRWYGVPFARPVSRTAMAVDEDRDAVRPRLAFHLGAMGAREKNLDVERAERAECAGHGGAARACQDAWAAGDREDAAADVPAALIDPMALACTPAELDDRLAAFAAVGVTTPVAVPCGDRPAVVRAPAAALGAGT